MNYFLICAVHNVLQLAVIALAVVTRGQFGGPGLALAVSGGILAILGLSVLVWAGLTLRRAEQRGRKADQEVLATDGPYRWVRHPYYLGDIIFLLGLSVALRSPWAIAATLSLVTTSSIVVGKTEEAALEEQFGDAWARFADRTWFLIPFLF